MDLDVIDPDIYVRGVPHERFRRLRAEAPVYWHAEPHGGRGFWAVTRHADVVAISRDPATWSSARGATFVHDPPADDLVAMKLFMLNMDPPEHVRLRNLVRHAFLPRAIQALEPRIRACVRALLDGLGARGEGDFVREVAAPLPLYVIAEMLGVPPADRTRIDQLSNCMVGFDDPELLAPASARCPLHAAAAAHTAGAAPATDAAAAVDDTEQRRRGQEAAKAAAFEVFHYAGELAARRAAAPGDDLVSLLVRGVHDGGLTPMELASFFLLLYVAGNETTRNLVSGGLAALFEHPGERARLAADRALLPSAVEEMLRWVSPIVYFRRTATRDVTLGNQRVREGDKVVMFYASANRDEAVFAAPERFDVGRAPNDHLAFGVGQHWCLGASLARLEARVLFDELLTRLPDLAPAGPPRRLRSNLVNAIKSMPVRCAARGRGQG